MSGSIAIQVTITKTIRAITMKWICKDQSFDRATPIITAAQA